jgi:hypothetical protein
MCEEITIFGTSYSTLFPVSEPATAEALACIYDSYNVFKLNCSNRSLSVNQTEFEFATGNREPSFCGADDPAISESM